MNQIRNSPGASAPQTPVAIVFGPENGAVSDKLVFEAAREAYAWRSTTATATTCPAGCSIPTTTASSSTAASGAWENLKKALKATHRESVWDHLAGAGSAPFEAGEHERIAVKVIDDRGNELLVVRNLKEAELR